MSLDDGREILSASATARRQAILHDALRAADRRRRSRIATQTGVIGALASAMLVAIVLWHHGRAPVPRVAITTMPVAPTTPTTFSVQTPHIDIEIIHPGDVPPRWETLSDDQLVAALADAGKPAGVARINGTAVVVPIQ